MKPQDKHILSDGIPDSREIQGPYQFRGEQMILTAPVLWKWIPNEVTCWENRTEAKFRDDPTENSPHLGVVYFNVKVSAKIICSFLQAHTYQLSQKRTEEAKPKNKNQKKKASDIEVVRCRGMCSLPPGGTRD